MVSQTQSVACPQCGTRSDLAPGEQAFCPNCDYPIFLESEPVEENPAIEAPEAGETVEFDAEATDVICRNCAERNPGIRRYCIRCGHELVREPEDEYDPSAPVTTEVAPSRPIWLQLLGAVAVLGVLGGIVAAVLYFFILTPSTPAIGHQTLVRPGDAGDELLDPGHVMIGNVIGGSPWLAYRDDAGAQMVLVACNDPYCETRTVNPIIVSGAPVDAQNIAVAPVAGGPAVFFTDANGNLKVMQCGGVPACNDTTVRAFSRVVDDATSTPVAGLNLAVAIGGGVAYFTFTNEGAMRSALLSERSCPRDATEVRCTIQMPLAGAPDGTPESTSVTKIGVVIPAGEPPFLVYRTGVADDEPQVLHLVRCNDSRCSGLSEAPLVLAQGDVSDDVELVLGPDGYPTVAYDTTEGALNVVDCSADGCQANTVVSSGATEVDLLVDADGRPILGYHDTVTGEVRVALCTDVSCAEAKTICTVDDANQGADTVGNDLVTVRAGDSLMLFYRFERAEAAEGQAAIGVRATRVVLSKLVHAERCFTL